jgi:two-component system nitrogen regulation response regulator NtrX
MAEDHDRLVRRVIVVDDEKNIRRTLEMVLDGEGYSVECMETAEELFPRLHESPVDAVLMDVRLPGMDGLQALERIRAEAPEVSVIMISGHATLNDAVRATRLGAFDFLEKPLSRERVLVAVRNCVERRSMAQRVRALEIAEGGDEEMLGASPAIERVREQIAKVAPTGVRVLVTGESGTGKELIARAVHRMSKRVTGPFVKVNCAAIPAELIESELFGHERGAFSGAVQKKKGRFELADGGTLFLDEIGDMSLEAQAKVLRALQTGEISRVGGERVFHVDVRVIAATNKDLEEEVEKGGFREDLFFRLSVVPVKSPALRERGSDILLLMRAFLGQFAREHAVSPVPELAPEVEDVLLRYAFPGNVRELRNLAERLVILAGNPIRLEDLPPQIAGAHGRSRPPTLAAAPAPVPEQLDAYARYGHMTLRELREAVERDFILKKLEETGWNVTRTAEQLGIERTNLHKKLKSLGVKKDVVA